MTPPEPGQTTEVAPGIHWHRLPLSSPLNHVNCYALADPDGWTLIDTGMDDPQTRALWHTLLNGPLGDKPVKRLIVTHHHPDHIGLAGWFQSQGAELLTTRTAWLTARMLTLDRQTSHTPETLLFLKRAGLTPDQLHQKAEERPFNFSDVVSPLPQGFTRLAEGSIITAAGRRWRIRLGQGHAPDHATLWSLDDNLIIAGDQMLATISPHIGVYPSEPEADPLTEYLTATRNLASHATENHLVLPGHKLPFQGLPARLEAMLEEHEAALTRLTHHLAEPRRATECFPVLFKREITAPTFSLALSESLAHLNCLLTRRAASRSLTPEGAWAYRAA